MLLQHMLPAIAAVLAASIPATAAAAPLQPTLIAPAQSEEPFYRDFRQKMRSLNEAELANYRKELSERIDKARTDKSDDLALHYSRLLVIVLEVQQGRGKR